MSRDSAAALSRGSYESPFLRPRIPKFYRHNTPPLPTTKPHFMWPNRASRNDPASRERPHRLGRAMTRISRQDAPSGGAPTLTVTEYFVTFASTTTYESALHWRMLTRHSGGRFWQSFAYFVAASPCPVVVAPSRRQCNKRFRDSCRCTLDQTNSSRHLLKRNAVFCEYQ